jgi:hypothetical protein
MKKKDYKCVCVRLFVEALTITICPQLLILFSVTLGCHKRWRKCDWIDKRYIFISLKNKNNFILCLKINWLLNVLEENYTSLLILVYLVEFLRIKHWNIWSVVVLWLTENNYIYTFKLNIETFNCLFQSVCFCCGRGMCNVTLLLCFYKVINITFISLALKPNRFVCINLLLLHDNNI